MTDLFRPRWRLVFASTLAVLLTAGLSGCDDGEEEDLETCSSDSDCLNGFTCRLSSTGRGVCVSVNPTDAVDSGDTVDSTDAVDSTDTQHDSDTAPEDTHDSSLPDTQSTDTNVDPGNPYRYVRINDLSAVDESINGGADIDAVILDKSDGTQEFATTVEGFNHGGGQVEGTEVNPTEALGAPDAFVDYTDPDPVCDLNDGYISLGGTGGYVIVGMGGFIETGDTITVLETGGCTGNDGAEGIIEELLVQVSVSFDIDAQWITLGQGEGPVLRLTVPTL